MLPAKESLVYFENISKWSRRIDPDSCDYGLVETAGMRADVSRHVAELKDVYPYTVSMWGNMHCVGGKSITFKVPYEIDNGICSGVKLKVAYNVDNRRNVKFYSVDVIRADFPVEDLK